MEEKEENKEKEELRWWKCLRNTLVFLLSRLRTECKELLCQLNFSLLLGEEEGDWEGWLDLEAQTIESSSMEDEASGGTS